MGRLLRAALGQRSAHEPAGLTDATISEIKRVDGAKELSAAVLKDHAGLERLSP